MTRWQYSRLVQVRRWQTFYDSEADPALWPMVESVDERRPSRLDGTESCTGINRRISDNVTATRRVVMTELHESCCATCRAHPRAGMQNSTERDSAEHENCCGWRPVRTPPSFAVTGSERLVTVRRQTFEDVVTTAWTVATTLVDQAGERTELELVVDNEPAEVDPALRQPLAGKYILPLDRATLAERAADVAQRALNRLGTEGWELSTEEIRNGIFSPQPGSAETSDWLQRTFWLRRPTE
ncbi:hypothetical protein [Amycolatopsis sp. cg9]|uniref:hypothetical protein n=1 Tax=Amycolatopsis sp. cg9 TaxID=3238801 RepID=UPI0035238B3D